MTRDASHWPHLKPGQSRAMTMAFPLSVVSRVFKLLPHWKAPWATFQSLVKTSHIRRTSVGPLRDTELRGPRHAHLLTPSTYLVQGLAPGTWQALGSVCSMRSVTRIPQPTGPEAVPRMRGLVTRTASSLSTSGR